jgi:transglutaminase-like putative cysteine protease
MSDEPGWQRVVEQSWEGNADKAGITRDSATGVAVLFAEWRAGASNPAFRLVNRVETADRQFDITHRNQPTERQEILRRNLHTLGESSDGLLRSTAERIVGRVRDPVAQAKLLYDWVIDRTRFDTKGSGAGKIDVAAMLERGEAVGRCADINGLFVALARAVGIPARLTYGLRVDQSQIVASLGQRGDLTNAQHCRAEFYAPGYAWVPADPADVRKALAEDGASLDRMKEAVLRKLLFGFWEMNWIGFHRNPDLPLRGAQSNLPPGLVAPWVEIGGQPPGAESRSSLKITATRGSDQ